ncbi:MAG: M28 family peptidase [Planctomycetota bacterium]
MPTPHRQHAPVAATLASLALASGLAACATNSTSSESTGDTAATVNPAPSGTTQGHSGHGYGSRSHASPAPDATPASLAPIRDALADADDNTRLFDMHIDALANPFTQGRLPGTAGMDRAEAYIEFFMQGAGLAPAFTNSAGDPSYFQEFEAGATTTVHTKSLTLAGTPLTADKDFNAIGFSSSGTATGPLVFVGYGIEEGPNGYSSFGDTSDLTGHVAVMARFEPMDDEGNSAWGAGSWTGAAGLNGKFAAVADRNPDAILFFTPSQANDGRVGRLENVNSIGGWDMGIPVMHVTPDALAAAIAAGSDTTLDQLIADANTTGQAVVLEGVTAEVTTDLTRDPIIARNVGGVIPGTGALADEWVIMGAHHDHLGPGRFGSRTPNRRGEIHNGADDNASGTAGVLVAAKILSEAYADMPDSQDRRSVLLMTFSAEESGLNGARYFVENPTMPVESIQCMLNMDMIGRIKNNRLSVSGTGSAEGWREVLQPIFDASPLTIVAPTEISGRSDHWPFYTKQIPVLFGIIADFHQDYHTPEDVVWKINRTGAADTAELFSNITLAMATQPEKLSYVGLDPNRQVTTAARPMASIKVRFGISPGSYGAGAEPGVLVGDVFPGNSAAEGGIEAGDRMVRWNGTDIPTVEAWMPQLSKHEPGDVVDVTVVRDGEEITLPITLKARGTGG